MSNPQMPTQAEIAEFRAQKAELARLTAENEALKLDGLKVATQSLGEGLSFKISEKGAFSVYGMGRWPVTLYREQWEKLFAVMGNLQAAVKANHDKLKVKPEKD